MLRTRFVRGDHAVAMCCILYTCSHNRRGAYSQTAQSSLCVVLTRIHSLFYSKRGEDGRFGKMAVVCLSNTWMPPALQQARTLESCRSSSGLKPYQAFLNHTHILHHNSLVRTVCNESTDGRVKIYHLINYIITYIISVKRTFRWLVYMLLR